MTDALIEAMARGMAVEDYGDYEHEGRFAAEIPENINIYRPLATAALAALRQTHAVVPREPTTEMLFQGWKASGKVNVHDVSATWHAMLAASATRPRDWQLCSRPDLYDIGKCCGTPDACAMLTAAEGEDNG